MKVYFFPYGVGEIVAVPDSKTLVVRFPDLTATVAKSEVIAL